MGLSGRGLGLRRLLLGPGLHDADSGAQLGQGGRDVAVDDIEWYRAGVQGSQHGLQLGRNTVLSRFDRWPGGARVGPHIPSRGTLFSPRTRPLLPPPRRAPPPPPSPPPPPR